MDPFIGQVMLFGGNFAPLNWAFCNGQLLSIQQYGALFSILGTTYGGDGIQTFALPDLRGRIAIHAGQAPGLSPYVPGQNGGTETVALTQNQLPAHTHQVAPAASTHDASQGTPSGAVPANTITRSGGGVNIYNTAANASMSAVNSSPAGGSQPHSNQQPYVAMNYIIALEGIYPSRP